VKRQTKALATILGVALLLSGVAAGCARRGGADVTTAPSTQPANPTATVAAQPSDAFDLTDTTVPDVTPEPASTDVPATSAAPANPTADPLDAQLQNVNQLLNGIDTSISGSSGGGE
jgi:hypothetical protein